MSGVSFERTYQVGAAPARVWEALLEARHLEKWFAEHARIEARVGGRYAFWGRYTGWVPTELQADQKITAIEAGKSLAFSWGWVGLKNDVRITLSEARGETSLDVAHRADREHETYGDDTSALFMDFWDVAAANLDGYLTNGKPVLLPDKESAQDGVVLMIEVDAPASRVFAALTDPAKMDQWLSKTAVVEARAGGAYRYGWMQASNNPNPVGPTKILEFVPDRVVVHDWHYRNEPRTTVRWELEPLPGNRTRVTLRHNVKDDSVFGAYVGGWAKFLLALRGFMRG